MNRCAHVLVGALVTLQGLTSARDAKAETLIVGELEVEMAAPAGWKITCRDPLVMIDPAKGRTGSVQLHAMTYPRDIDPAVAHRSHSEEAKKRAQNGELVRADEREISGIPGVLSIEAVQDPLLRQMTWVGNDRRGYFHWTFSASAAQFDEYLPLFTKALDSATISPGALPAPR